MFPLSPIATLTALSPITTLTALSPIATLTPLSPIATLTALSPKATLTALSPIGTLTALAVNYKEALQDIGIEEYLKNPLTCDCSHSPFQYNPSGHVITGVLNSIQQVSEK